MYHNKMCGTHGRNVFKARTSTIITVVEPKALAENRQTPQFYRLLLLALARELLKKNNTYCTHFVCLPFTLCAYNPLLLTTPL